MPLKIKPTEKEVNDLINQCSDADMEGKTKYPGMTYEQGILNAIRWITGDSDDGPMD